MMRRMPRAKTGTKNERGFSILEAMIASMIMIIGVGGLMALFTVVAAKNAGQGNQATRCTEYAQDKAEQLMALQFADEVGGTVGPSEVVGSNTICGPLPSGTSCSGYNSSYATGLGGTADSTTYGAAGPITTSPSYVTPVTGYVDYVNPVYDTADPDGIGPNLTTNGGNAQYIREWSITTNSTNTVKTITVYVQALFTADVSQRLAPSTTLVVVKQQY